MAGSEPGQLGPVGHAEFRGRVRELHLDGISGHEQCPRDVWIAQALAGQLGHLPLDRAQAGPPVRGARMLAAAALGVGDGLLERQSGPLLECIFNNSRRPVPAAASVAAPAVRSTVSSDLSTKPWIWSRIWPETMPGPVRGKLAAFMRSGCFLVPVIRGPA